MKIIDAVWEKRNLGVTCAEIEVDINDSPESVIEILNRRTEQYIVVKISNKNTPVAMAVQKEGFCFIESLVRIEADHSKGVFIPEVCKRLVKNIGWHLASNGEIEETLSQIRAGTIFSTDRISLDPYFSQEIAGRRYSYWISDLLEKGNSELIIAEYLGENVGFIVYTHKEQYSSPVLSGLFSDYLGTGMGFVISCCSQMYICQKGIRHSVSHISTNNFENLNLSTLFNNKYTELKHVFIKHQ